MNGTIPARSYRKNGVRVPDHFARPGAGDACVVCGERITALGRVARHAWELDQMWGRNSYGGVTDGRFAIYRDSDAPEARPFALWDEWAGEPVRIGFYATVADAKAASYAAR